MKGSHVFLRSPMAIVKGRKEEETERREDAGGGRRRGAERGEMSTRETWSTRLATLAFFGNLVFFSL